MCPLPAFKVVCTRAAQIGLLAGLLATSAVTHAGSALSTASSKASAPLDIRVIIPATLRILEDSHPKRLLSAGNRQEGMASEQRIVMLSTLRKGFCMDMLLGTSQIANWKMQLRGSVDARIESRSGGYRLCVSRAGRYELALSHDFELGAGTAAATPMDWPVHLSLSAP